MINTVVVEGCSGTCDECVIGRSSWFGISTYIITPFAYFRSVDFIKFFVIDAIGTLITERGVIFADIKAFAVGVAVRSCTQKEEEHSKK